LSRYPEDYNRGKTKAKCEGVEEEKDYPPASPFPLISQVKCSKILNSEKEG
jgi:hypothetical protein